MDQVEATSKHLKNMIKEVNENLQNRIEEFKAMIRKLKENISSSQRAYQNEKTRLIHELEDEQRLEKSLIAKKEIIRASLEKEHADLFKLEKEYEELVDHVNNLENTNRNLLESQIDAEEKNKTLNLKCKVLKEKNELKHKQQKCLNDNFRHFLGIDIVKIKEDLVKIVFNNLEASCYVLIDFSKEECVSETHPELSLEKLNFMFKEKGSFYEFIKYVREELKRKI